MQVQPSARPQRVAVSARSRAPSTSLRPCKGKRLEGLASDIVFDRVVLLDSGRGWGRGFDTGLVFGRRRGEQAIARTPYHVVRARRCDVGPALADGLGGYMCMLRHTSPLLDAAACCLLCGLTASDRVWQLLPRRTRQDRSKGCRGGIVSNVCLGSGWKAAAGVVQVTVSRSTGAYPGVPTQLADVCAAKPPPRSSRAFAPLSRKVSLAS